ncbi:LPS translocon maturation chaperone LptM [Paraferrimonas haliotis]|uniref:Lipoprotein-attachment site-containing protein n=1 Tax=Paraferrimonas haliotis TaxID=2013866 RepID=A0AA37TMP4_9GAMM|nr:lipoprotein [Paraferrimonas haliotis]GLS82245.1 hypothetical protein GCM10007894_02220 [Paraferrimonas haliotis]
MMNAIIECIINDKQDRTRNMKQTLFVAALLLAMAGCGQKGALYHAEPEDTNQQQAPQQPEKPVAPKTEQAID